MSHALNFDPGPADTGGMFWRFRASVLIALCAPLAAAASGSGGPAAAPGGFRLPAAVGELERTDVSRLDSIKENLRTTYTGPEPLQLTLYVYAAELGCGPGLEADFQCAREAIRLRNGAELLGTAAVTVPLAGGRVPALLGSARIAGDEGVSHSMVLVARAGAHYVKVRASYDAGRLQSGQVQARISDLLEATSGAFARTPAWASETETVRQGIALVRSSPAPRNLDGLLAMLAEAARESDSVQVELAAALERRGRPEVPAAIDE